MTILLWLAEFIGIKGLKSLSAGMVKWTVRLGLLVVLVILVIAHPAYAVGIAALWLLWVVLRALWRNRKSNAVAGERTIDGKVVPEKLAVAALDIPAQSPGGDYVLRGLPEFGKALLKLDARQFEYLPEIPESEPVPLPLEEATVKQTWFRVPGWAALAGAALLPLVTIYAAEYFNLVRWRQAAVLMIPVAALGGIGGAAFQWWRGRKVEVGAALGITAAVAALVVVLVAGMVIWEKQQQKENAAESFREEIEETLKTARITKYKTRGQSYLLKAMAAAAATAGLPATDEVKDDIALNAAAAFDAYEEAADLGDAEAQCKMGELYNNALPILAIPHDSAKAKEWFRKAAAQGYAPAVEKLSRWRDPEEVKKY